jgi:hypothetical protein
MRFGVSTEDDGVGSFNSADASLLEASAALKMTGIEFREGVQPLCAIVSATLLALRQCAAALPILLTAAWPHPEPPACR